MPVTPLHIGPAIVLKAACGRNFSLLVFAFSQVAMDIEPAVRFLRQDGVLHGFTHTYAGATLIGVISLVLGRPFCRWFLRTFRPDPRSPFLVWLHGPDDISWSAAAVSAFLGTYSHVLLDSVMHGDMAPFAPWSEANGLLLALPVDTLNALCLATGVLGMLLMVGAFLLRSRRAS